MNGIELFEQLKVVSTVAELLQSVSGKTPAVTQSMRGNMFEKVWDCVIKFGFCPDLPNDTYDHYEGNVNENIVNKVDNLEKYVQKMSVFSKGKGGSSDITLKNKKTEKWVFMSSKFYLDDSKKSVDDYDVEKIIAATGQHSYKYKDSDIYLIVNNKQKVLNIINASQSTNNYITKNIDKILDVDDLEVYFQNMKRALQDVAIDGVNAIFGNAKVPLTLRFHQDLITNKQMDKINEGATKLLLGAKARSGKTYCVGGLLIKFYKKRGSLNALIITPAPRETMTQFTDDLFDKFLDFNGTNVVEIKKGTDFAKMDLQKNNIIIVSKQLLDDYVLDKKVSAIQSLELDFIVFDENHFHGTTQMSKDILQSYSCQKTVKLFLTATYAKPLSEWNVPLDCQHYWDIEDEQWCKKRNIQALVEKHGDDVHLLLTEENKNILLSPYDNMPDLHILTTMMVKGKYDAIKLKIKDTSYGFSNGTLCCGDFPDEVDTMLRLISGSNKEEDYPAGDMSMFGRIKKMCKESNSRTKLNNGDFTSQLWFLPYGINMQIATVSEHVKDRMMKNSTLNKYEIKIVNSKKDYNVKEIKKEIKNWEEKAKEDGKYGLILLAGSQLTLGITLPFVDIVVLLNDTISADKIVQMMYRSMTESINNSENDKINNGNKKFGFVIDLNISRVLNTMLDYNVHKKDFTVDQKITYLVENNLMNIDSDLFKGKENKTKLVENLLQIWKENPTNHLTMLLRKLEDCIIEHIDSNDQKLCNQMFMNSVGDKKVNVKVKVDEESEDVLSTGKEIIKQCDDGAESVEEVEESIDVDISITKDVLPFIIPLICILTLSTAHKDILEMLNTIKSNPSLLDVFNDQSFIWWNKPDVIKLIELIVEKYVKKNSDIYNIAIQFKMSLQNLIDKPKELLELIHSCLKPKQKEKEEAGEVYTPMDIVFKKLDKLDDNYIKVHGRSIFTEKGFKWFDPAVGMGNYMVAIYLRLIEGLKPQIPNDEDRKKHIIENMLYMSEINKKNVFICHQIFNINNQYKMNLHEGDTLELDIMIKWKVARHGFDVIIGNPPYNTGGIRSHTGKHLGEKNETIWTKFVELSFEWLKPDGFLVFINPLSWLKKSHSMHNVMLEKHIIWLKLWDNIKSLATINGKIPISLYILQNTLNKDNKKTEIMSEIQSKKLTTTSTEYLNKNDSIPLAFHSIFNKLSSFIETKKLQLECKTKTIKSSDETKTKIPAEYTLEDRWAVDTYTIKEGLMVKKVAEQHPDADKRKLIIANKASFNGAFIDEGKLSLTGNHKYYILGDNLELIKKMLGFGIINIIGHYTKYGQDFLDNAAFKYLPDIRKLGITDITEDEFYKLIELTQLEINQIKNPSCPDEVTEDIVENVFTANEELPVVMRTMKIKRPNIKSLVHIEENA